MRGGTPVFGDLEPYRHSGKLGQSWWTAPLAGLIAAVVGGFIYAYVDVYVPLGVVMLLVVFGFIVAMAAAVGTAGYVGKCRNPLFLRAVGFATGLLGWYISWVVFEYALLNRIDQRAQLGLWELFASPSLQWNIAKSIAAKGWFAAFGVHPKGIALWTLWGIEALLLIGGTTFLSSTALEDEVFCERCNEWTADSQIELTDPGEPERVLNVHEDNLEPILELVPAAPDAPAFVRIKLWECISCDETSAFSIERGVRVPDKESGKMEETTTSLVPPTLIAPSMLDVLRSLEEDSEVELEVREWGEVDSEIEEAEDEEG